MTNLLSQRLTVDCGKLSLRYAKRVWNEIRKIFEERHTMTSLPPGVGVWYVIGAFGNMKLLASSPELAPIKPPEYIALVDGEKTFVIERRGRDYRTVYVDVLRKVAKATVVPAVEAAAAPPA